ncbi:equilibrative nucleotide transporter [Acrasis kona]|uniref:Equilibrative nucleotide transporter n=1 Tax=Acrasis kona TaxID=1008807 RepID=A0AAW2YKB3_9EUKA
MSRNPSRHTSPNSRPSSYIKSNYLTPGSERDSGSEDESSSQEEEATYEDDENLLKTQDGDLDASFTRDEKHLPKLISSPKKKTVRDNYHSAYILFFLLGIGAIIPSQVFLITVDFFRDTFPGHINYIEYILPFGNNAAQVISIMIMLLLCRKPGYIYRQSLQLSSFSELAGRVFYWSTFDRVIISWVTNFLSLFTVCCMMVTLTSEYIGELSDLKEAILWIMVACNCICGLASGWLIASLFSFAALFPWEYTQSVMGGMGMAGALVAIARIAIKLLVIFPGQTMEYDSFIGSLILFGVCCLVQFVCMLLFMVLIRRPITRYYQKRQIRLERQELINASLNGEGHHTHLPNSTMLSVVRRLLSPGFVLTFVITFVVMPGVLSDISAMSYALKESKWMTIITLAVFSISDCLGRMLPGWKRTIIMSHSHLWIPILLRAAFIPIIVLITYRQYALLDVWVFIIVFFFGLSHGYCAAVDMMVAPGLVAQSKREREYAGVTMTLFLNAGLLVGSSFAMIFVMIKYLPT